MSSYDSILTTRTPVVDSDRNDAVVEMKGKKNSRGKAVVVILACAGILAYATVAVVRSGGGGAVSTTSSVAFATTSMRGGDTTATTVLATVTGGSTTEEPSCIDRYDICVWGGVAGHCCYGRTCLIRCL